MILKTVAFAGSALLALTMSQGAQADPNIIRAFAPVTQASQDLPVIAAFSIRPQTVTDAAWAATHNYSFSLDFAASNYDALAIKYPDGTTVDVSGKSSFVAKTTRPLQAATYQLIAKKNGKQATRSADTRPIRWCGYVYDQLQWRSYPGELRLLDSEQGLSVKANSFDYQANGWYYGYNESEMQLTPNDNEYQLCKSGSPINQDPLPRSLAQCTAYDYSVNRWIDNGSTQSLAWSDMSITFRVTLNQRAKTYDRDGWRYYPNPYDTGDNIYTMCRQAIN